MGIIGEHNGCISALEFWGTSHLLSGSEDGKLGLFRTSDWECLHLLHHKTPVSAVAVHPSGKLAISIAAADKSLKLWNLVTGKGAGRARLPFAAEKIIWSPTGTRYAVHSPTKLAIYSATETSEPIKIISASAQTVPKFLTVRFVDEDRLLVAGEGSKIALVGLGENDQARLIVTPQKPRIKDLVILRSASDLDLVLTLASDSTIAVWTLESLQNPETTEPAPLIVHSLRGIRPICMTATIQ